MNHGHARIYQLPNMVSIELLHVILISSQLIIQTSSNLSYPASRSYLCSEDYKNPRNPPKICERNSKLFRNNREYDYNKQRNDWSQIWNELKDFDENDGGTPVGSRQFIPPSDPNRKSLLYEIFTKSTAFDSDLLCSANFDDNSKGPWSSNFWLEFPENENPFKRITPVKPGKKMTFVYKFRGNRKPDTGKHGFIDIYVTKEQGFRPRSTDSSRQAKRMRMEDLSDQPFCSINRKIKKHEWKRVKNTFKYDQRPIWQFSFNCKLPKTTSTGPQVLFSVMKTDNEFECDSHLAHRQAGGKCRRVYFGCSDVLVDLNIVQDYEFESNLAEDDEFEPNLDEDDEFEPILPQDEEFELGDPSQSTKHKDGFWLIINIILALFCILLIILIIVTCFKCNK